MQFFLPLMLIIYLQMGGENTKKSKGKSFWDAVCEMCEYVGVDVEE